MKVSIPYSTIKRAGFNPYLAISGGFQFLIVQLKVIEDSKDFQRSRRFQFLIVQLKGYILGRDNQG